MRLILPFLSINLTVNETHELPYPFANEKKQQQKTTKTVRSLPPENTDSKYRDKLIPKSVPLLSLPA